MDPQPPASDDNSEVGLGEIPRDTRGENSRDEDEPGRDDRGEDSVESQRGAEDARPGGPRVVLVRVDHKAGNVTFVRSDRKERVERLPTPMEIPRIVTSSYSPDWPGIVMECDEGSMFVVETVDASPGSVQRPVVYLDQNQWSTISKCLYDPDGQLPADVDASVQIAAWCDTGRLRLPVSMGHLLETTQWPDQVRRERLALTLLRLSRGWKMRHPLDIRRSEVIQACAGSKAGSVDPPANAEAKDGSVSEVFTTAAGALYETGSLPAPRAPMGFPVAATAQYEALTAASTLTSVVLHPEPISRVKYGRWAEVNQRLSAAVDDLDTRELKQRLVDRALLKDLQPDLAAAANKAGVSLGLHPEMDTSRGWDALSDCPSLAMYRQIYTLKHLDRGSRWEDNDLIDLTYLAPAVTYADAVACEAKAASLFARALPVSDRKVPVVTKLPALVEVLESLIR